MFLCLLGGFSTLVASFLARARGSNEPELSITRVKDLEQFIRECQAFKMDYGHVLGDKYDNELHVFRNRFEELLGNANGQVSPLSRSIVRNNEVLTTLTTERGDFPLLYDPPRTLHRQTLQTHRQKASPTSVT